jgi:hypothetical protein
MKTGIRTTDTRLKISSTKKKNSYFVKNMQISINLDEKYA